MKFNLKIVAAIGAVAMMSTGVANAAATVTVPGGPYIYSKEGLALTGTGAVDLPNIEITFGNNLTYQDSIFITLPGVVSLPLTPTPTLVTCVPETSAVGYVTEVNGGWEFRVTSVNGVNLGDTCTFTGLKVQGASLSNAPGTINYIAKRFITNQTVDTGSSGTGIGVRSQFNVWTRQALNGEIDVFKNRTAFTEDELIPPGAGSDQNDTLNFSTVTNGLVDEDGILPDYTELSPLVSTFSQVVTIKGDFTWVNTDGDGTCGDSSEWSNAIEGYSDWGVVTGVGGSDCTKLVLEDGSGNTGTPGSDGYFHVPGSIILNPQDYTGSITWGYCLEESSSTCSSLTQEWDPGAWTINGAQVYIQYMPYGQNIGRIIYAANRGPIDATAEADIFYNGSKYKCDLGAVDSQTVNMLSAMVDNCVINEVGLTGSGKVAILLTFTAPDKDIEVYSAYNVNNSDRGTVVNTSNGRTFFYGSGNKTYQDLVDDVSDAVVDALD